MNALVVLSQKIYVGYQYYESMARNILLTTDIVRKLIDLIGLYTSDPVCERRAKLYMNLLEVLVECYNESDQEMNIVMWRSSTQNLSQGSQFLDLLLSLLKNDVSFVWKQSSVLFYKWSLSDPQCLTQFAGNPNNLAVSFE
jgi:hypothetical protein